MTNQIQLPRIAILGAGGWATGMHLPMMKRLLQEGHATYAGVCDLDQERAQHFGHTLSCDVYSDFEGMLETTKPDGVIIIVSPEVTPKLVPVAVKHQLPFLIEKPPATDVGTHKELIELVGDLAHVVAYNRRHSVYVDKALSLIDHNAILGVESRFSRYARRDPDFTSTAVHALDLTQYLLQDDLSEAYLSIHPAGDHTDFFLQSTSKQGRHLHLSVTPFCGASHEHYWIKTANDVVQIRFPQNGMYDLPGGVTHIRENKIVGEYGPDDFGLSPDDNPGLGGIYHEHLRFAHIIQGKAKAVSTLKTSLSTQILRDGFLSLMEKGAPGHLHLPTI